MRKVSTLDRNQFLMGTDINTSFIDDRRYVII